LKVVEGGLKFGPGAAGELQSAQNADLGIRLNQFAGLFDLLFVNKNLPRHQQGLGFMAAFGKAAFHEQLIDAPFH
jgi:hypothetical protein